MAIGAKDVIPLSQARSRLSEIADEVKTGSEKIITKNGESYVALSMPTAWTITIVWSANASTCCCWRKPKRAWPT